MVSGILSLDACKINYMKFDILKKNIPVSRKRFIFIVFLVGVLSVLRLIMSLSLHMWYAWDESFDDQLLMSYTSRDHFFSLDNLTLAKNAGYSYWLLLVYLLKVPIDVAQFLIWLIAAFVVTVAFYSVFANIFISIFVYLYVLWNPLAFENWLGTRVYRNSLVPPLMFILLGLLIIFMNKICPLLFHKNEKIADIKCSKIISFFIISVFLGIVFAFVYIQKEDSIWLLPMYIFCVGYTFISILRRVSNKKKKIYLTIISLVPLIMAWGGVTAASSINWVFHGVNVLNTRTEGEIAEFASNVYQIENPDQTTEIWAPVSSIEKAFSASATLQKNPKLLQSIKTVIFAGGDINKNPLTGDHFAWQLRFAIDDSMGWNSESEIQAYFKQVNLELEEAFNSGVLQRTNKITLSNSMVPMTSSEITSLIKPTFRAFYWSINPLEQYMVTSSKNDTLNEVRKISSEGNTDKGESDVLFGYRRLGIDPHDPNPEFVSFSLCQNVANVVTIIYSIVNHLLLIILFVNMVCIIKTKIWRVSSRANIIIFSCLLLAYSFIYSFIVTWYDQFVESEYVTFFYTAGYISPLVVTSFIISLGVLAAFRDEWERCAEVRQLFLGSKL